MKLVTLTINGRAQCKAIAPNMTLLDFLRDELNLTGTKNGCDSGECGCCSVLLGCKPILSCLMLAVEAEGRDVTTIEGIAQKGVMHPVQEAIIRLGGLQCSFCTAGVILSSVALLNRNPDPDDEEIRHALAGNLCRCTGFTKIINAVKDAAKTLREQKKSKPRKKRAA